jgi:la-related protein 1
LTNGTTPEGANGAAVPNGHPIEESTKAVSAEPDLFCDAQMERLTVIVRRQNKSLAALRPSTYRTFSNGSIDSKSGGVDELDSVSSNHSLATGAVSLPE